MRLSSQSSQFIFNLPSDFLPQEIINRYRPILEKNWIQYENIIDYINSTIKSVSFKGISQSPVSQTLIRGKKRDFKPATNVQDLITRDITVTFDSVDADLNYWLLFDIWKKHYMDVENVFINPFTITALDIHRDAIYIIKLYEIIMKDLKGNTFDYSQQRVNEKTFDISFGFNFYDIEFVLDKSKILELESVPQIIQKL
jgi:hypothetical protein